jgi:hypothetical protein
MCCEAIGTLHLRLKQIAQFNLYSISNEYIIRVLTDFTNPGFNPCKLQLLIPRQLHRGQVKFLAYLSRS